MGLFCFDFTAAEGAVAVAVVVAVADVVASAVVVVVVFVDNATDVAASFNSNSPFILGFADFRPISSFLGEVTSWPAFIRDLAD